MTDVRRPRLAPVLPSHQQSSSSRSIAALDLHTRAKNQVLLISCTRHAPDSHSDCVIGRTLHRWRQIGVGTKGLKTRLEGNPVELHISGWFVPLLRTRKATKVLHYYRSILGRYLPGYALLFTYPYLGRPNLLAYRYFHPLRSFAFCCWNRMAMLFNRDRSFSNATRRCQAPSAFILEYM